MAVILNSAILDSVILVLSLKLTAHLPNYNICTKKLYSFVLTQLDDMQLSWILPSWIQSFCTKSSTSNSFILTQLDDGSHLEFCYLWFSHFAQKELHSFILTQLDDGSHLEFCHVGFRHCHLGLRYLGIFCQIHSKDTLLSSLWLTQKHSILNSAILDLAILHKTLTQTNSIWLKLIHSHLTWWWQSSWILPSWIQPS